MTINIADTLFPNFEFAPIYDLDVSPMGTFHVYPVNSTRYIEDVSMERAILKANDAPADGLAVVFFAIPALDSGFRDVDSGSRRQPRRQGRLRDNAGVPFRVVPRRHDSQRRSRSNSTPATRTPSARKSCWTETSRQTTP